MGAEADEIKKEGRNRRAEIVALINDEQEVESNPKEDHLEFEVLI